MGKEFRSPLGKDIVTFTTDDIECVRALEKALDTKITIRRPYVGWQHVVERHFTKD